MIIYQCPDNGYYPLSFDIAHTKEPLNSSRTRITYYNEDLETEQLFCILSSYGEEYNIIYRKPDE